jgi:uncharacterized protein YbjT (DUF2867 family)
MTHNRTVAVYGASGHTGRFVVAELLRRGWRPILSGRDAARLEVLASAHGGLDVRPAAIDRPAELDRALVGAAAVLNCAGPFATTAGPLVEAALRAGIAYLDVAAEIEAVADTLSRHDGDARDRGVPIVTAVAFFGGLGDLLATAAMGAWPAADEITIAYALDSWHPTPGTRAAGAVSRQRRDGRRVVYTGGRMVHRDDVAPTLEWAFPDPIGTQPVRSQFTMADSVTIPHHLTTPEIRTHMSVAAAGDVADPDVPPPVPTDESGRSAQTFLVHVVVRSGGEERRAVAAGRDIYAITAPLLAEATERVLHDGFDRIGTMTAGQAFDAPTVLRTLPLTRLDLPAV